MSAVMMLDERASSAPSLPMVSSLGELVWGGSSQLSDCHLQIGYCGFDRRSSAATWYYIVNSPNLLRFLLNPDKVTAFIL